MLRHQLISHTTAATSVLFIVGVYWMSKVFANIVCISYKYFLFSNNYRMHHT